VFSVIIVNVYFVWCLLVIVVVGGFGIVVLSICVVDIMEF